MPKFLYINDKLGKYSVSHSDAVQHLSRGVGARHCRAPTGVPHANEKRYRQRSSGIFSML
ncbi:hypothetical protein [Nostoc sp.]|uniref:hypothetical protein n=1 Tax=Nostoc sp. TaxID=1180 RepID=UPI002FFC99D7